MTAQEAFKDFLNRPALVALVGMSAVNLRKYKSKMNMNPSSVRYDTMKEWLAKAGYVEKVEWTEP